MSVWACLFPVKPDAGLAKDGPTIYRTCRRTKPGTLIGCAAVDTPDLVAAEFARPGVLSFSMGVTEHDGSPSHQSELAWMSRRGWWVSALHREDCRRDSSRGINTRAIARESRLGHPWGRNACE